MLMEVYLQVLAAAAPLIEQMPENKYGVQRAVREVTHLWGKHAAWLCLLCSQILQMQHWNLLLSEMFFSLFFSTNEAMRRGQNILAFSQTAGQ